MRVKKESERARLKLNINKTKNVGPRSITSWQIEGGGGGMEAMTDFLFLVSKITVNGDCSLMK